MHNVVSSLVSQSEPVVRPRLPGLNQTSSSKQWVNVTCSKPKQTVPRPGLEPVTPWSVVCDANHCASPPQNKDWTVREGAADNCHADLQAMEEHKQRLRYAGRLRVAIPGGPKRSILLNLLLQDSLRYSVS